jgi:hypothetical protein
MLVALTACGGAAFEPGAQRQELQTDAGHEDDAPVAEDDGGQDAGHDAAHDGGSVVDATPVESGGQDAMLSPDAPGWQYACFGGDGVPADAPPTTGNCTPLGMSTKCGGCTGASYGYSCADQLPPTQSCSQWRSDGTTFCCETNVCVRDPSLDQKCQAETLDQNATGFTCAAGGKFPCSDAGVAPVDGYQGCCP